MESDQNNPGNSARKPVYPILSNRQIYPGSPGSRKVSPQKDFTGSSNSLTGSDHGGSRKFLNLIHEGAKFCLVQGDQGKKLFNNELIRSICGSCLFDRLPNFEIGVEF